MSNKPTTTVHVHHQGQRIDLPADKCADIVRVGLAHLVEIEKTTLVDADGEDAMAALSALRVESSNHAADAQSARRERDRQHYASVHWKNEAEKLAARVAELEREHGELAAIELAQVATMRAERDRALARVEELKAEIVTDNSVIIPQIAAERDSALKRAAELEQHNKDLAIAVQKYGDDLAAVKASHNYLTFCDVKMQRDAARAAVAALKREVETLRQYGNKDCTYMADAALRDAGIKAEA